MNPIFVLIFWLHITNPGEQTESFDIAQIEFGGVASKPDKCAGLLMADALKPLKDAPTNIANGLVPKIVCGMAAPDNSPMQTEPPKPHAQAPASNPGHGEWDKGPSGEL